jgi:predicted GNAT family N-acyltransferase
MSQLEIYPLSEKPEYAETCAAWDFAHWGAITKDYSYKTALVYYQDNIAKDGLTETLIGCIDSKVICMGGLKESEHPDRTDLTPWIGDVYVQYFYRKNGYGHQMCKALQKLAKEKYGFNNIYLQTRDPQFYQKAGWLKIGTVTDMSGFDPNGETLMKIEL